MVIEDKLQKDITDYCTLNGLDIDEFLNKIIRKGLNLEKYGEKPPFLMKKEEKVNKVEEPKKEESEKNEEKKEEVTVSGDTGEDNIILKVKKPTKRVTKRKLS